MGAATSDAVSTRSVGVVAPPAAARRVDAVMPSSIPRIPPVVSGANPVPLDSGETLGTNRRSAGRIGAVQRSGSPERGALIPLFAVCVAVVLVALGLGRGIWVA